MLIHLLPGRSETEPDTHAARGDATAARVLWVGRPALEGGSALLSQPLASHRAPGWHLARGLPLCVALSILLTGPEGPGEGVGAGVSGSCYPASLGAGGVGRTLNAARGACG